MDTAITFFNDFDRFCDVELEKKSKMEPAITFFDDFDFDLRGGLGNCEELAGGTGGDHRLEPAL